MLLFLQKLKTVIEYLNEYHLITPSDITLTVNHSIDYSIATIFELLNNEIVYINAGACF